MLNMKNIILITFLIIIINNICLGQSKSETMSKILCEKLESIDINQDIKTLNKESVSAIQKTYKENQGLIREIMTDLKKNLKNKSDLEISKVIGQNITYYSMKNCENYQRITIFKNKPTPEISKTTKYIGIIFKKILEEKIKRKKISYNILDKSMFEAMKIKEKELIKKFGSFYSDNFTKEFTAFLMTKCEPYMRWTASLMN